MSDIVSLIASPVKAESSLLQSYHALTGAKGLVANDGDGQVGKFSWDGVLST